MTRYALLLDLDGTVIDSRTALLNSWYTSTGEVLGRRFPATDEELAWVFRARGADIFGAICASERQAGELSAAFDRAYANQSTETYEGMHDALADAGRAGLCIALVTSKARVRVDRDLDAAGLTDCFEAIVTGDDVQHAKPHPEGVLLALELLGVDAAAAVLCGDTSADLEAGVAAGVRTIHARWGYGDPSIGETADEVCIEPAHLMEATAGALGLLWKNERLEDRI